MRGHVWNGEENPISLSCCYGVSWGNEEEWWPVLCPLLAAIWWDVGGAMGAGDRRPLWGGTWEPQHGKMSKRETLIKITFQSCIIHHLLKWSSLRKLIIHNSFFPLPKNITFSNASLQVLCRKAKLWIDFIFSGQGNWKEKINNKNWS